MKKGNNERRRTVRAVTQDVVRLWTRAGIMGYKTRTPAFPALKAVPDYMIRLS